jgi:hypothetical protein
MSSINLQGGSMRARTVLFGLMVAFASAPQAYSSIPVFIKITASDRVLHDAVNTSIKAALRRLGDVEIVYEDKDADYVVELAASPFRDPDSGKTIGFALGVTYETVITAVMLTESDGEWMKEAATTECVSVEKMREHFGRMRTYSVALGSWVFYGSMSNVEQVCAQIVRDFDNTFLEVQRAGKLGRR